jgi:regulator of replication initiation timing
MSVFSSKIKDKISMLESGLEKLEFRHIQLVEENKSLRLENHKLKSEVEELGKELRYYQNKEEATKIIDLFEIEQSAQSDFASKIDDYIRAIDNCINLLEKQS